MTPPQQATPAGSAGRGADVGMLSANIVIGPNTGGVSMGPGGNSAYGGGDGCTSIVQTAVGIVDQDGQMKQSMSLPGTVLAVDVAASADGSLVAIATAGMHDPNAPTSVSPFFGDKFGPMGGSFMGGEGVRGAEIVDMVYRASGDEKAAALKELNRIANFHHIHTIPLIGHHRTTSVIPGSPTS